MLKIVLATGFCEQVNESSGSIESRELSFTKLTSSSTSRRIVSTGIGLVIFLCRTYKIKASLNVAFEVLTTVVIQSFIPWDIAKSSPLKVERSFGATRCLHLQGRRTSQARNQQK